MTNPDLDKLARGLTEAQREWLRDAWYGNGGWRINYRKKACDLGLTNPGTSLLTPLGLALKAHIESQRHDDQP
jgi:hypothetical protein